MNFLIASWYIQPKSSFTYLLSHQFFKAYLVVLSAISTQWATKSINWNQLTSIQNQANWSLLNKKRIAISTYNNVVLKKRNNKSYNVQFSDSYRIHKFYFIAVWWMQLTRPKSNYGYRNNAKFRLFFTTGASMKSTFMLVSINRYLHRLTESLTFIRNLFYTVDRHWMLGNELFLEELLVFNWETQWLTYKLFKFVHVSIYCKDLSHGSTARSILYALLKRKLDFIIIVDLIAHAKTNIYLQK